MVRAIKEKLNELAEEEYRRFTAVLLPNVENILGVRLPILRKLAREIAKGDWRGYLAAANREMGSTTEHGIDNGAEGVTEGVTEGVAEGVMIHEYFEEIMLQGLVLGYVKTDTVEKLRYVAAFIPRINNWSACDSFCTNLKFTKDNKESVWNFLQPYFSSDKEYELRFGIVMLLNYYMEDGYIGRVLPLLDSIKHEGYYVKMAVAWAVSVCYIKYPEQTMEYLKDNTLDDFTYNKSLQKIAESFRVDESAKDIIRGMKRK